MERLEELVEISRWCLCISSNLMLTLRIFFPSLYSVLSSLLAYLCFSWLCNGDLCPWEEMLRRVASSGASVRRVFRDPTVNMVSCQQDHFYYDLELSALLLGASQFCRFKLMAGLSLWGLVSISNQPL